MIHSMVKMYSVMLTINDLTESDFNAMHTVQLSYGVNKIVQYSVSLESEVSKHRNQCCFKYTI